MADPFGVSFSPANQQSGNTQQQQGRPTPVQQAIQTLSLRIPRVAGAGSLAPQALLNSPGGANVGGPVDAASMLEQIKRMLFGNQQPGQIGTGPDLPRDNGGSAPMPPSPMDPGGRGMPVPGPGGFTPPWQPPPQQPGAPPEAPPAPPMAPSVTPGGGDTRDPEQPYQPPPPPMAPSAPIYREPSGPRQRI